MRKDFCTPSIAFFKDRYKILAVLALAVPREARALSQRKEVSEPRLGIPKRPGALLGVQECHPEKEGNMSALPDTIQSQYQVLLSELIGRISDY